MGVNTSYKQTRVVKAVIEWINLFDWQAKQLHDIVLELSQNVPDELANKDRISLSLWKISDLVQRIKKISMRQLGFVQKVYYVQKNDILYIRGLEFWLNRNDKQREAWVKRRNSLLDFEGKK